LLFRERTRSAAHASLGSLIGLPPHPRRHVLPAKTKGKARGEREGGDDCGEQDVHEDRANAELVQGDDRGQRDDPVLDQPPEETGVPRTAVAPPLADGPRKPNMPVLAAAAPRPTRSSSPTTRRPSSFAIHQPINSNRSAPINFGMKLKRLSNSAASGANSNSAER